MCLGSEGVGMDGAVNVNMGVEAVGMGEGVASSQLAFR